MVLKIDTVVDSRCGCVDDMPSPAECGRCSNGGKPLPPYRVSHDDESEHELGYYTPKFDAVVDIIGGKGDITFGVMREPTRCGCGNQLDVDADVFRMSAGAPWQGSLCCGGRSHPDTQPRDLLDGR